MASAGSYKGVNITPGTDAEIAAQVAAIDARSKTTAVTTPTKTTTRTPTTPTTTTRSTSNSDAFLASLQQKLMSQSELVSSSSSKIDKAISSAISNLQKSGESSRTATTLSYNRQISEAQKQGSQALMTAEEQQRGYAVNTGLLRNITETTTKQINDLELRKQEALAIGDAATAQNVAQLQMQGLQFQQQAQQQIFQNLVSTAGLALQFQQGELAKQNQAFNQEMAARSQNFQESNAMSQIALQYGVALQPGDTIDSVVARAQPFASESQRLQLEQMRASIRQSNAQTSKALADAQADKSLDASSIEAIARASLINPAVLGLLKNVDQAGAVINKAAEIQYGQFKDSATQDRESGLTKAQAIAGVQANELVSAQDKALMLKAVEEVYKGVPEPESRSFFDIFRVNLSNQSTPKTGTMMPDYAAGYQPLNINFFGK